MHPDVQRTIHAVIADSGIRPHRALEVGGVMGPASLLRSPALERVERYCLNLVPMSSSDGITAVTGNGNDLSRFADGSFDLVLCNATLEHDKRFWLSLREMHRVLAPGGMLILGTPGYTANPARDHGKFTHTYKVHYKFDYYRFSDQAFREVFFEGMEDVAVQPILAPPRIIGVGFKPGGDGDAADRGAAAHALRTTAPRTVDVPEPKRRTPRRKQRVGALLHRLGHRRG